MSDKNKTSNESKTSISKYVKRNFKDVKATTVKAVAGTVIVASIAMGPQAAPRREFAEPTSISTFVKPNDSYIVEQGDNLTTIYLKTGIRADIIKKINNLSHDEIHEGQVLKLL